MSPDEAGVVGGVAGAVVGVVATMYVAHRQEKREAKAAARLLLAELGEARRDIAFALDENDWASLATDPPQLLSWDRVSQTLAATARPATWRTVTVAARAVDLVADVSRSVGGSRRIYPDADPDAPGDSDRFELSDAQREIEQAIFALTRKGKFRDEAEAITLDRELADRYPD